MVWIEPALVNDTDHSDLVRVRYEVNEVWKPHHSCAPNFLLEDWKLIGVSRDTIQNSFKLRAKTERKVYILLKIPLKR